MFYFVTTTWHSIKLISSYINYSWKITIFNFQQNVHNGIFYNIILTLGVSLLYFMICIYLEFKSARSRDLKRNIGLWELSMNNFKVILTLFNVCIVMKSLATEANSQVCLRSVEKRSSPISLGVFLSWTLLAKFWLEIDDSHF